jgi:hypothetical protein
MKKYNYFIKRVNPVTRRIGLDLYEIRVKRWTKLTDDYVSKVKQNAHRKIRLQGKSQEEVWAYWDKKEECWFWHQGEDAVYMDEPSDRPTHILVG